MAAVVGEFAGGAVAPDQQLTVARRWAGEVDDGPVIEEAALRAASGGQLLPGPLRELPGQRVGAELSRTGGHFGRAGHCQDIAHAASFQGCPQFRVAAVDLIAGYPADTVPGVQEPFDHHAGQVRLGREDVVLAEPRRLATLRVRGPRARDVQLSVHRRVPAHR